jgi:hypothetical protein
MLWVLNQALVPDGILLLTKPNSIKTCSIKEPLVWMRALPALSIQSQAPPN